MLYKRGTFIANTSQSAAITHKLAPLMIIAGAGTGKTTTLLHRIYYLIEHYKLAPENILAITYTEKAAEELKLRIVGKIGNTAKAMTISTFHAFCYNIVYENLELENSNPILMEEGDAIYLFLQKFDELGPFESRTFVTNPIKTITESFIPFINRLRDELIDPSQQINPDIDENIFIDDMDAQLNDLKRIYPLYQKWKKEQNFVDFGDQILDCYKLLQSDDKVLKKIQKQYQYIIIDEFQDNNFALNEVVKQIVGNSGQITVVGDEDQVVYSFRGAGKYNIANFRETYYRNDNYAEITLEENFRSIQEILNVANDSISNAVNRDHKMLSAVDRRVGEKPHLFFADNKFHPMLISDKIKELTEHYEYQDMAVLCRTRKKVKEISEYLASNYIPTRTYLINFFEIPAIKDLIAWCNLVAETDRQDTSLYRILSQYVGKRTANNLFNQFSRRDYSPRFELIKNHENVKIKRLVSLVLELRKLIPKKNASEMVWEICISSKILRPLLKNNEWHDQLALQNIAQLIDRSQEFTVRHKNNNSLKSFTNYLSVLHDSNSIQTIYPSEQYASQKVLISTIHGVKGAEFSVVFIPYNRAASFPLNFKKNDYISNPPKAWLRYSTNNQLTPKEQHIEEERRLFYVGLTRAKELLYLYAPKKATSKFIKELNQDNLTVTTMENEINTLKIQTNSELRSTYEKRLANALSQNQFSLSKQLLKTIERINQIERSLPFDWGESDWEIELKSLLINHDKTEISEKLNLSASSIETYQQCPLKYRLSNIDKIPQVSSKPTSTFGNIIHKTLEKFHEPGSEQSLNRLLNLLDTNWESLGFEYEAQEADFKRQGIEILTNYFDYLEKNPTEIIERELAFSFEIENIIISGKIDRIDKSETGYRVVDYKTSKRATKANKSLQLAIYSMYLQQENNFEFGGNPESATLYFLRDAEEPVRAHKFTIAELLEIRQTIIDVSKNIKNQEFTPCSGFHCEWCDYKYLLCPKWEEK